jgi:hypothetical protein
MKLVSPASLSGAEGLVYQNLKEWLPLNGVCVNVMLGRDPWDLRPLILQNNKVTLYRFSKPLDPAARRALAAEMQGFSVIPGWEMRIEHREVSDRLLMARPFVQATLADLIVQGGGVIGPRRQELLSDLIALVKVLRKRSLVHGHISPANIAEVEGGLILLDPRLGALHYSKDQHLAPEVVAGGEPTESSDLFGLGSVLLSLLGDDATHQQRELIDRLLLPAPRQRPSIEEVEKEFARSLPAQSRQALRAGRVVSIASQPLKGAQPRVSNPSGSTHGEKRSGKRVLAVGSLLLVTAAAIGVRLSYPALSNDLLRHLPFVAHSFSAEYARDWTSNDKLLMKIVAQAAIEEHDVSAENTILEDTLSGQNRPGVSANLLRVALSDLWVSELSAIDKRAAVALSVLSIYPEGIKTLPDLTSLHSGVLLAVVGQTRPKKASEQLKSLSIDRLAALPGPVGELFSRLKASGSTDLASPEVIALAGMVSGNPPAETLESYIQPEDSPSVALARLSIALPLLAANESMAQQVLAILRDRGDELGKVLSWFDIDSLSIWGKVKSSERLGLVLGALPSRELAAENYADLLTFPLAEVRGKSAHALKVRFLQSESDQLFELLSGPQNGFSRDQNVALLSSLSIEESKRAPYLEILFKTKPTPEMVLLLLLARSNKGASDVLNLEASRLLRKSSWQASNEILSLLASHPEPLARALAYARLSPRNPEQKKILQKRLSEESEPNLIKSITEKLAPQVAPTTPITDTLSGMAPTN